MRGTSLAWCGIFACVAVLTTAASCRKREPIPSVEERQKPSTAKKSKEPVGPILEASTNALCLEEQNKLKRWGVPLGKPSKSIPGVVPFAAPVERLACGNAHACAITTGGEAWCVGDNTSLQLGGATKETCHWGPVADGSLAPAPCSSSPRRVPVVPKMADVAIGGSETCVSLVRERCFVGGKSHGCGSEPPEQCAHAGRTARLRLRASVAPANAMLGCLGGGCFWYRCG